MEENYSNGRILTDGNVVLYLFKLHQFYFPPSSGMDEEIDDFEIALLIREMFNRDEVDDNERLENQPEENNGNEADDEDDEFVVLGSNQVNY